jgi:hypothetical protein
MSGTGRGLKSGVKPNGGDPSPKPKGVSRAGSVLTGIVGAVWALLCGLMAIGYLIASASSFWSQAMAIILVAASALLSIAPVVRLFRQLVGFLRPTAVPPIAAVILFVLSATLGIPHSPLAPGDSPTAGSPETLSTQDALTEARAALTAGDHDRALTLLTALPEREQTGNVEVAQVMKQAFDRNRALEYPAQVREYVLPEIAALAAPDASADVSEVWNTISKFEDLARQMEDASALPLNDDGRAALGRAKAALSRKQTELFPMLRRGWRERAATNFWLMDVEVDVSGARADTITWTGAMFAANANIAQSQSTFAEQAAKLRFRQSRYRWFSRADRVSTYTLQPPADGTVGYSNGGAFVTLD